MTGIAAQAEASNRSSVPASSADWRSSGPWRERSCLFAVTTAFPASSALRR